MGLVVSIILMIIFLLISYEINSKDIASPSIIIFLVFIVSAIFSFINYSKWEISIGATYIFTIVLGFVATLVGEQLGKYFGRKVVFFRRRDSIKSKMGGIINVPLSLNILLIFLMLAITFLYYKDMMRIASIYGTLSLQSPLQAIRNATYSVGSAGDLENGLSTGLSHGVLFCRAAGYVYLYIFLNNLVYSVKKNRVIKNLIYLIPCIIYLLQSILTTSRSQILYYFAAAVMIWYLLYYCKNGAISHKFKIKFIKYGLISIALFCIVFYILGFLTRKSDSIDFFNNISVYIGGSQVSLNNWLEKYDGVKSLYWGEESFVGLCKVMYRLSLTDHYAVRHLEFINFGVNRGNVYTAFRRYISDFGFTGMFVLQFLSTFIVSSMYAKIKKIKRPCALIIVYGYISYSFAMEAIDELMFSAVFEISNLYILIYGTLLYIILIKKRRRVDGKTFVE